ncbi:MAG: HDOD domain-containing protein, partial [Candidatus Latescibacterota bacterium]
LLHDFGEVILELFFPERHATARKLAMDKGIPIHIAEREILGIDHSEVGGWTLEEWDMPENITESVARHHSFDRNTYHVRKTAVIHVADVLAFAVDYRGPDWEKVPEMSRDALDVLGFTENELKDFLLTIMRMPFDPIVI